MGDIAAYSPIPDVLGGRQAQVSGCFEKPLATLRDVALFVIQGSKHPVSVRERGIIEIGCQRHSVNYWERHYPRIARRHEYNEAAIREYLKHLAYAKDWMADHGLL